MLQLVLFNWKLIGRMFFENRHGREVGPDRVPGGRDLSAFPHHSHSNIRYLSEAPKEENNSSSESDGHLRDRGDTESSGLSEPGCAVLDKWTERQSAERDRLCDPSAAAHRADRQSLFWVSCAGEYELRWSGWSREGRKRRDREGNEELHVPEASRPRPLDLDRLHERDRRGAEWTDWTERSLRTWTEQSRTEQTLFGRREAARAARSGRSDTLLNSGHFLVFSRYFYSFSESFQHFQILEQVSNQDQIIFLVYISSIWSIQVTSSWFQV